MRTVFEAAGDLRGVDLLAAFVGFWRENENGSVRFSRPGGSAGFDIAQGEFVGVFSSEPRFETASVLVRAGKLDAATLQRLSVAPGSDAALAALRAGVLTRREWRWGEKIRAIEVLSDLLGWAEGKYIFDSEARPGPGEFALPIPRLLLELFLRSRDRNLIEHQLGPPDVALIRSDNFDLEFVTFGLTADAESVVRLIDGRASAAEIAEKAPADEFAVFKLLAALATLGMVRPALAPPLSTPPPRETPFGTRPEGEGEPESAVPLGSFQEAHQATDAPEPPSPEDFGAAGDRPDDSKSVPPPTLQEPEIGAEGREFLERQETAEEQSRGEFLPGFPMSAQPLSPARPNRSSGVLWASLLLLLIAAVAAIVIVRSQPGSREEPLARRPPSSRLTPAVGRVGLSTVSPPPAPTRARLASERRPSPAPTKKTPRAATPTRLTAPVSVTKPRADERSDPSRQEWLQRAERDRRRLQSEPGARYAIQLLLACEVPTLVDAWKHEAPAGSLWLLKTPHAGRDCFRVLWGRYPTLEAARSAKAGIPGYFVTGTNRPAVVSVR